MNPCMVILDLIRGIGEEINLLTENLDHSVYSGNQPTFFVCLIETLLRPELTKKISGRLLTGC